jgi:hypothetical protein
VRNIFAATALLLAAIAPASAMTIKEFRKFSTEEQSMYIGAGLGMLVYTYAANGNPAKARCIQEWYYGEPGKKGPGPHDITLELLRAERIDPEKYHVEGILIGLTDQVCKQPLPPARR